MAMSIQAYDSCILRCCFESGSSLDRQPRTSRPGWMAPKIRLRPRTLGKYPPPYEKAARNTSAEAFWHARLFGSILKEVQGQCPTRNLRNIPQIVLRHLNLIRQFAAKPKPWLKLLHQSRGLTTAQVGYHNQLSWNYRYITRGDDHKVYSMLSSRVHLIS